MFVLPKHTSYVCNGCVQLPTCTLLKCIYDPVDTHVRAHLVTSEVRIGILSNEEDISMISRLNHHQSYGQKRAVTSSNLSVLC